MQPIEFVQGDDAANQIWHHTSNDYYTSAQERAQQEKEDEVTGFLIGAGVFILTALLVWFVMKKWSSGALSFGKRSRFNADKLAQAYIYLSADMLRRDVVDVKDKTNYVHSYIQQHFPDSFEDFRLFFDHVLKHPISPIQISVWIKTHLGQKDKMQVMYFLAGMAFIDGSVNRREMQLLRYLQNQLEISPKEFDQVIAMYTQQRKRSESRKSQSSTTRKPSKSAQQLAYEILGVSYNANWDEIKKAYRQLVKMHHPDRFASESKEQQEIAQQRFIEIQKAYELIEATK